MIDFASILGNTAKGAGSDIVSQAVGIPDPAALLSGDTNQMLSTGLSTVGNLLLPGIGGMIGSTVGGMLGGKSKEQERMESIASARNAAKQEMNQEAMSVQNMTNAIEDRKKELAKLQTPISFMNTGKNNG